jgi:hypothetical protein
LDKLDADKYTKYTTRDRTFWFDEKKFPADMKAGEKIDVYDIESVPEDFRNRAVAELKRQGRPVSVDAVLKAYNRKLQGMIPNGK